MNLQLNKIQVAKIQIEAAIEMFFNLEHPVVIHTIVGAADLLLDQYCKSRKIKSSWGHTIENSSPDEAKEFYKSIRRSRNFFKHADNDEDEVLEFSVQENDALIFATILSYQITENTVTSLMKKYFVWFAFEYSEWLEKMKFKDDAGEILQKLRNHQPSIKQVWLSLGNTKEERMLNFIKSKDLEQLY